MIKISLITPMRGQHELFENLMNTLIKNTAHPNEIQVLICLDDDDKVSLDRIIEWETKYLNFNLTFFHRERSEHFTKDYINFLAKQASGRFVMAINADSEFVTKDWDLLIYEKMDYYCALSEDEVWLGLVKDNIARVGEDPHFPNFSCWPIVSKSTIDNMGYFFDERFKIWGPDHFIAIIYRKIKRLVSLTFVIVNHKSIHTGQRVDDGNYEHFQRIDRQYPFVITDEVIKAEVEHLKSFTNKKINL